MIAIGFSTCEGRLARALRRLTRSRVTRAFFLIGPLPAPVLDVIYEGTGAGYRMTCRAELLRGSVRLVATVESAGTDDLSDALGRARAWLRRPRRPAWLARLRGRRWPSSEAVVRILQDAGFPRSRALNPRATSPDALLRFLEHSPFATVSWQ